MGLASITLRSQRDGMSVVSFSLTFLKSSRWVSISRAALSAQAIGFLVARLFRSAIL